LKRRGDGKRWPPNSYQKSHPYGVGRGKFIRVVPDKGYVDIKSVPTYQAPLSFSRRGAGGEDRKSEGLGMRFKRTAAGFEIKSRFAWGKAVLTAIKISTTQNPSFVRWAAQMRGGVEQ